MDAVTSTFFAQEKVLPVTDIHQSISHLLMAKMITVIKSLDSSELVSDALHERSQLVQQLPTDRSWSLETPHGLEGIVRSIYGSINVLGSSLADFCYQLAIG